MYEKAMYGPLHIGLLILTLHLHFTQQQHTHYITGYGYSLQCNMQPMLYAKSYELQCNRLFTHV